MPRPIGTTFADLLGKLTVVLVECSKLALFEFDSGPFRDHVGTGVIT